VPRTDDSRRESREARPHEPLGIVGDSVSIHCNVSSMRNDAGKREEEENVPADGDD
jgi:hypothetical protein